MLFSGIRLTMALAVVAALLLPTVARADDPTTVDCLTASEKSLSLRNDHKLRAARAQLLVCASSSCPADIRKECGRRVDEVNAAIPTIVFGAKDPKGNDLSAVKVTMDGEVIADKLEGTSISLDPGAHTFTFESAGQPTTSKAIVLREGDKERREIVQLGQPSTSVPVQPGTGPKTDDTGKGLGPQRIAGLAVGSVGVASLIVGAAFGGLAISVHNNAKDVCPAKGCPTQNGVDLWNTSHSYGNVSTAMLVVGGVMTVGGVVLFATGGTSAKSKQAALTVGPGSLSFEEAW